MTFFVQFMSFPHFAYRISANSFHAEETILFWKWKMWKFSYNCRILAFFYFINWIVATETIQGRKLFAEIRYFLYLHSVINNKYIRVELEGFKSTITYFRVGTTKKPKKNGIVIIEGQLISEMVFCYHNCSNVLWEKIVLVWGKKSESRKKFANSRPKGREFVMFLRFIFFPNTKNIFFPQ